ncbi:MAG TPA: ribonuclease HII [Candidatus Baltobacteraceae bacterium]|jgi:ribonuclease HII|nr:ribonuclease HII [Candidatus Baltobacteraceae bacterium]
MTQLKPRRTVEAAGAAERERLLSLHHYEFAARERGFRLIGGIDEVGRGPLAGPVVAACVVIEENLNLPGLDDSKRVPAKKREQLAAQITDQAASWAIGEADVAEIDVHNIYQATLVAMKRALDALAIAPQYLIADAMHIHGFTGEQLALIKGDSLSATVAAASILAKVHRDRILAKLDAQFPAYGFAHHKGYATPEHLAALRRLGPCEHHRRSFAPVRASLTDERSPVLFPLNIP